MQFSRVCWCVLFLIGIVFYEYAAAMANVPREADTKDTERSTPLETAEFLALPAPDDCSGANPSWFF